MSDRAAEVMTEALEAHPAEDLYQQLLARYVLVTGSRDYEQAFLKVLRNRQDGATEFTPEERRAWQHGKALQRSLTVTDPASSAGLLAPYVLDTQLNYTGATVADPVRQNARVVSGASPEWRGISGAALSSAWLDELDEFPDAAESLSQPVIKAEKHGTDAVVSWETLSDTATALPLLQELFAFRKAEVEAAAFINGAGASATPGQPQGITTGLNGTASEIAPTVAETFTVIADLKKVYAALGPAHRANGRWLLNVSTYLKAREAVAAADATNAPIFNSDETLLFGKPWDEASSLRAFSDLNAAQTSDINYLAVFGNLRQGYTVYDRIGTTVVPYVALGSNRRTIGADHISMYWRVGAGVTNVTALRMLSIPTTA